MGVLRARRPRHFISAVPVQQRDLLLFSTSPRNNTPSRSRCSPLIYEPSHKKSAVREERAAPQSGPLQLLVALVGLRGAQVDL